MEITPGLYKHFKGGMYKVLGVARHSETLEPMVVYMSLYHKADREDHRLWVRPAEMFFELVTKPEYTGPRFIKLADTGPYICKDCGESL